MDWMSTKLHFSYSFRDLTNFFFPACGAFEDDLSASILNNTYFFLLCFFGGFGT